MTDTPHPRGPLAPVPVAGAREKPRLRKGPLLLIALLLLGVLWRGAVRHADRDREAGAFQQAQADAVLSLRVAEVKKIAGPYHIELPAQTLAFEQARLFARATGYIAERRVDIGSKVKQGDLLLRIAAPDLDQQYAQAKANLALSKAQLLQSKAQVEQTKANLNLAKITYGRASTLAKNNYESKQNADNARATVETQTANLQSAEAGVAVAQATIDANQANLDRLAQLVGFKDVTAPFKGVVTVRNVDIGDLVSADANGGTALFQLARDDVLRVQVSAPQAEAQGLVDGLEARILSTELGKTFKGRVTRNAVSLDPASRTLLTEIDIPNPTGELRPGQFVRVVLDIPRVRAHVNVPAPAILFGAQGPRVAVVGKDDVIRMASIVIARDYGTSVDVEEGLSGDERVVLDPPVDIRDGRKVTIRQ
ncbi:MULTISPECIES: efflux RND transporter periplasmic adaptor subunit [Methylosinus]|uniref:Efflux RND transporter periplasmic adaptor subunit n=1 Tax=Methylosinus trichosporium (strain ATCC 35070 / NCIMB 11131 / UNIQEM 75 / OB3b) TaxID=595536 RepID=A0A2D2D0E4_METT3|nr:MULTISPECIES: efflux RND transporter periplasmic adaptor subunit [Methylosinus]ATQ68414.1 efflux RND transporter periplasmic adaptor subunit [Methylosinus trichosporium OB3b]OBS51348.1 efflux transporter periplasmic adaptor subunit [Methylosinus sp. 3S-1]